jgi:hypothetical protein
MLRSNPFFPIGLNSCSRFFTYLTAREHLFHGRPIRLNPPPIVSAVPVRWHADLREAQHRTVLGLLDIEDGNRVMIGPPTGGAPCLNDLAPGFNTRLNPVMCPFQAANLPGTWVLTIAFSPESDWCFFESISNS